MHHIQALPDTFTVEKLNVLLDSVRVQIPSGTPVFKGTSEGLLVARLLTQGSLRTLILHGYE